jgi:dTDP-4-amino-4,6-dideoxygalactose transaminase
MNFHCETAARLYHHALSLPCSVGLTKDQQAYVIEKVCGLARP